MTAGRLEGRRILMTLDAVGGVWRYTLDLAAGLVDRGATVALLGFGPEPDDAQRAEAARVGPLEWSAAPLDWMVDGPAELAEIPDLLTEAVARHKADLLHLHLPSMAAGFAGDPANHRRDPTRPAVPVVAVSHSCVPTWCDAVDGAAPSGDYAWHVEINAAGLGAADAVVAPSRSHGAALGRIYGLLPNLAVIHNGVRPGPGHAVRAPAVLCAGRWWDRGKDGATLDAAAATIPWSVILAGALRQGDEHLDLAYASSAGQVAPGELRGMMSRAGLFVAPSRYEPFGLGVAEAATAATPLLLSDIPTFRELWQDAARFFPPGDAEALSREANALIADADLRAELGEAARLRSARYTLDRQADAVAGLYLDLLRSVRAPANAAAQSGALPAQRIG